MTPQPGRGPGICLLLLPGLPACSGIYGEPPGVWPRGTQCNKERRWQREEGARSRPGGPREAFWKTRQQRMRGSAGGGKGLGQSKAGRQRPKDRTTEGGKRQECRERAAQGAGLSHTAKAWVGLGVGRVSGKPTLQK